MHFPAQLQICVVHRGDNELAHQISPLPVPAATVVLSGLVLTLQTDRVGPVSLKLQRWLLVSQILECSTFNPFINN
jgi:hypothetical protein